MKSHVIWALFVLVVCGCITAPSLAQTEEKPAEPKPPAVETAPPPPPPAAQPCPSIEIQKPQQPVRDGTPVKFRVNLNGGGKIPPFFSWSISAGSVISGQGTPSLEVDTTGAGAEKTLTASVLVGGLPSECMTYDATATINIAGPAQKLDEYGALPDEQENAKLDAFVATVSPADQAYIIAYAGKSTLRGQTSTDLRKIRSYLIKGGTPPERLVTMDGGYREQPTRELWIVPIGAEPPKATPTVNSKEVVFLKPPAPAPKKP